MTRLVGPASSSDEHWAPDHLVLAGQVLSYGGRLLVEWDDDGVLLDSPLDGIAAVEQRYPSWAQGTFGRISPETPLTSAPGVYVLVDAGKPCYAGAAHSLAQMFGERDGLGLITRRTSQLPDGRTLCRLNRLITTSAERGRVIDLYHLVTGAAPNPFRALLGRRPQAPEELAREIADAANGPWQTPR